MSTCDIEDSGIAMAVSTFVTFTTVSAPILKPSSSSVSNRSAALPLGLGFETKRRLRGSMQSSSLDVARASASSASASTSPAAEAAEKQKEAAVMVQEFYAAINRREISSIGDLFADDCSYEDLVFPKPFAGRKAILEFFQKFMDSVGSELEFRIDDITTGDPDAAGVIWHLEWKGRPLPFSKGCSFYRCKVINGNRQFVYGRDAVEPATKPGNLTLVALKGLAALLRTFPSLADRF